MNDQQNNPDSPRQENSSLEENSPSEKMAQPEKKSGEQKPHLSRARRWRRRLTWLVVFLLGCSVISRLLIIFILPPVLRHVAKAYGLTAQYERMELYLVDGDVGIWHLSLTPIEGGDPLIQSEYARCDISVLNLLRGRLAVRRLEAEGIELLVERKADGTVPLLQRFNFPASAAAQSPASPSSSPRIIDLTSPLQIDAFRLTDIRAHVIDSAVSPRLDANVSLSLRLTDVDSPLRPAHFEMELTAPPILDLLHVEGTGTSKGKQLQADLRVLAQGVHPIPAAGYLLPLGIQPSASSISLSMNANLKTTASTTRPDAVAANLTLSNMAANSDGQEAAALDNITLDADAIDFSTAQIKQFLVQGARCTARRDSQGLIGIAGFDLVPPASQPRSRSSPPSSLPLIPLHWSLGLLELRDLGAAFEDQSISPAAKLAFHLDDLTIQNISPDQSQPPSPIHGRFTMPGLIDAIALDGQTQPFAATRTFDIKLRADGIKPEALRPYLDSLGLESDYAGGTFTASVHADASQASDGSFVSNAALTDVLLQDNASNFLNFDSLNVAGASYDPAVGRVRVKSIDISGPQITGRREADGDFSGFGFHTKPKIVSSRPAPATRPAASPSQLLLPVLPRLQIDRFTWKNIRAHFDDLAVSPQTSLAISDAGIELTNLNLDFDPASTSPSSGQIRAWLVAPNLAPSITVAGSVNPITDGLAIDLSIDGKGLTSNRLDPYFHNSRIHPVLRDGSFHLDTHLALATSGDRATGSLDVKNFVIKDGSSDLLAVDAAQIDDFSADPSGLAVHQISLASPRLGASRDENGAIQLLGLRIEPPPPGEPPRQNLDLTDQSAIATASSPHGNLSAVIDDLNVHQASISWTDHFFQPAASAHLTIDADLQNSVLGKTAPPARLNVTVHEDKALDQLTIAGDIQPSLTDPTAKLNIDASGIRAGDLAPYAPPSSAVNLRNAKFHVAIDAAAHPNLAGGFSGHLLFSDLNFHDDPAAPALCRFESAGVTASRIDPAAHLVAIDEISLAGFEAAASRSQDGSLRLLGLTLGGAAPIHSSPSTRPAASNPVPAPSSPTPQAQAITAANLAKLAQKKYPLISIDKINLNVRRVSVSDESHPKSAPLALVDLQLTALHRTELLGNDSFSAPPIDLQLTGSIDPLVKSLTAQIRLAPFAARPFMVLDVALAGIRGSGLTDLLPDLKPQIDGSQMTDGRFKAHLGVALRRQIRDPSDLDLSTGFAADVSARGIEYHDKPDGPVLAGLDEVTAQNVRVQPDTQTVLIPDVELTNITAHLFRDAAGIHVLGWIIKLPQPAQTTAAAAKPAQPAKSANPAPASSPVAPQKPSGEIAITKLIVSGLDFRFEDRVCDPPLIFPLNGLDMEARDLSSRMPYEDKSCRFNILVNAGKFPVAGKNPAEQRDLFSQAEVSGDVSLYPQPKGWAKSSVSAFDLSSITGEAKQQGVDLNGGTFDGSADLRFKGDGTVDARCRLTLTDLKIKEPPNGPIARFLKVDVPLDVAIAAVQDQDGSINVPVDVPIQSSGISTPAIAAATGRAIGSVILSAIAATPLKAADTVLSVFGKDKPKKDEPVTLTFAPAENTLGLQDILLLRSLLDQMHDDDTLQLTLRHQVGGGDAARAQILANPSSEDCRNLAYRLQLRKSELLQARQAAAERVRAQLASGFGSNTGESIQRLREIDRALAANEDALDNVYGMLAPGAVRQSARRTRAACIQIGTDRLDAVRIALGSSGLPNIEKRINVTHAIYNPLDNDAGGTVTIIPTHKKPD